MTMNFQTMSMYMIVRVSLEGLDSLAGCLAAAGLLAASKDVLQDGQGSHLLIF